MKKSLWYCSITMLFVLALTNSVLAQWAANKYAREDARYVRVMQGSEDVTVDGVEEAIWANADSIVVAYNQKADLRGSGYFWKEGQHVDGDSTNAVCKFLYKAPYIYLLFRTNDNNVGGLDWEQFDGVIISFKQYTESHAWVQAWDKRVEHFYTYGWKWAKTDTIAPVGDQPLFKGSPSVGSGIEGEPGDGWGKEEDRTAAQRDRWMAVSTVLGGTSNDSLPDEGWVSEHRMRVDSLGFDINGDVLPFSFSFWDADGYLDSTIDNNRFGKAWWQVEWNENWNYGALYIDPSITTATPGSPVPPVDYFLPHLRSGSSITVDGNLSDWDTDNALHLRAKWGDDAGFDAIRGTGAWASGYQQMDWNGLSTVVDGPEVDYWVTYDDANMYVSAKVADQIVTMPGEGGRKDGISFFMYPRAYTPGSGIAPVKTLTVNVDSLGNGQAGDDLISMADTAGVTFSLMLGNGTNINDVAEVDSGFTVELKLPFAAFAYPEDLGDSVIFIGGLANDIDVFEDVASNYYAKTWWFKQEPGQKAPAWVALGPADISTDVNDKPSIPLSIKLYDNYPNPFNPSTTIKYDINVNSDVTLSVYNSLGQLVSEMKRSNVPAGSAEFKFNASNLSSGVYFYQLKVKNLTNSQVTNTRTNKMVLLK